MKCSKCGCKNPEGAVVCSVCGANLEEQENMPDNGYGEVVAKRRSRWVALLCAWIGFGLYQWYLGDKEGARQRVKLFLKGMCLAIFIIGFFYIGKLVVLTLKDFFTVIFSKEIYDHDGNIVTW